MTLRTPGTQYLAAFDLATFTIIGYAVVDVAAPDGSPGTFGVGAGFADLIAALQGNKGLSRHRDVLSELLPL